MRAKMSATSLAILALPPLVHQSFLARTSTGSLLYPSILVCFILRRREGTILSCEPAVVLVTGGDQATLTYPPPPCCCCCCRRCSRWRSTLPPPTPAGSPYPPSTDPTLTTPSTMLTAMFSFVEDPPTVCALI